MSKVLVIVHGAGKQASDFYERPVDDLEHVLGRRPVAIPVWYGAISNIGSPVRGGTRAAPPGASEFQRELQDTIMSRLEASHGPTTSDQTGQTRGASTRGLGSFTTLVADLVADVTGYLFNKELRDELRTEMIKGLDEARGLAKDGETVVVSHSLGTVIAYDVLHDHARHYNVSHFITMGSPLAKLVASGVRDSDPGQITPSSVMVWKNLYDTTDPVADAIGTRFPDYPVCDVFIDAATSMIPSHDYWSRDPVLRLIAAVL